MESARPLQGLAVLGIVGGSLAVWLAFQRQMCAMAGGGGGGCAPNIAYLLPGLLAVLVGIGVVVFLRRARPREEGR